MKHVFFLAPAGRGQGLTTVALGLVEALDRCGVRVAFYKPINENPEEDPGPERSTHFLRALTTLAPVEALPLPKVAKLVSDGRLDEVLVKVIEAYHDSTKGVDMVVVEGLPPSPDDSYRGVLNQALVKALNGQIILVAAMDDKSFVELDDQIEYAANVFGGIEKIAGLIVNRYPQTETATGLAADYLLRSRLFRRGSFHLVGAVPHNRALTFCRSVDVQRHLHAVIMNAGEMQKRRVKSTTILARTVPNLLHYLTPGALLATPADRNDIIIAVSMAALSRVPLAGLILTGDTEIDQRVIEFCRPAFDTGLPLFRVTTDSYETGTKLYQLSPEVPIDDLERMQAAMKHVAHSIDVDWLISRSKTELEFRMSPAAFLHRLTEKSRQAQRRIVLPEGAEPRTIRAAAICAQRGIARCLLLGDPREIDAVAKSQDLRLPTDFEVIDPIAVRSKYVQTLFEFRKEKGLSLEMAASQLEDNVVLGTMMLAEGEVDGLVSGAIHSTANTIRPALQIIKTRPNAKVVSSIFFMCLPDQVLVYGDCAVIPDPDAETLADIAIQSADSAAAFGIPPRVAMISYSTGESGSGADVEKVREATKLAQGRRPDLLIDGPLQYDAAFMPDVAKTKAPDSPVAGRATVFIFPDLNTGNTTYKAVQRSANVISIGPMLQGLKRPVNDLSRGALVDDIVYTIALTAIQATQVV
ncbi:MAG: phosphate acetyltransferase [Verrucomicrobia bacterium]|nr:phosphate acetyltransferase [Verrucomicrobiota bacterium]